MNLAPLGKPPKPAAGCELPLNDNTTVLNLDINSVVVSQVGTVFAVPGSL